MFKIYIFHQFNKALIKINFGILLIMLISSKKLLLLDKNLIIVLEEVSNISKNIFGIFSGCLPKTFKNILSKNRYFFPKLYFLIFQYRLYV